MKRKIYSIFLSFLVLFTSFFSALLPCFCSHATALAPVAEIAGYILSSIGAIDLLSGGSVRGVTTSVKDSLIQKISDLMGTGIYEDSNGNYVFSGEATQQIYDVLLGSDNIYSSVNLVSDFGGNSPSSDMLYTYDSTFDLRARNQLQQTISSSGFSSYLCRLTKLNGSSTEGSTSYTDYYYSFQLFDLTDVAYLIVSNKVYDDQTRLYFRIYFYDSSGNNISVNRKQFIVSKHGNNAIDYGTVGSGSGAWFGSYFTASYLRFGNSFTNTLEQYAGYYDNSFFLYSTGNLIPSYLTDSNSLDSVVNYMPFTTTNNNHKGSVFWSNKSVIFATNTNYADRVINQTSGTMVANTFSVIPSVSKNVIENNNWESIYNEYVQNVNIEYDNGNNLSVDDLRNIMKRFSDNINNSVSSGVDNLEEIISSTNSWLKKILQKINEILEYLNNNPSSSSGGSGSSSGGTDYSTILNNIYTSLGTLNTTSSGILSDCDTLILRLTAMNNKLQDILDELQSMDLNVTVSPAPDSHFNPTVNLPDIYNELNAPDFNIDSSWLKTQGMITALKDVMPLCYLFLMVDFVSSVSSEPIAPRFEIPFRFNSTSIASAQFNENLVLDFTLEEFESFHSILENVICFIFCIWLIFISFRLIQVIMSFF